MSRNVIVTIDGMTSEVTTRALTVRGAVRSAGYRLVRHDNVTPSAGSWLSKTTEIEVERSRQVQIWFDPVSEIVMVNTAARTGAEILAAAGIEANEKDEVRVNGKVYPLTEEIPLYGDITLQYIPVSILTITSNGISATVETTSQTIGQALWENGIQLVGSDLLSQPFNSKFVSGSEVVITAAVPVEISVDGKTIKTYAAADTVGKALAFAGIVLQDLDYSIPAETDPIPADGKIQVVRVSEKVLLQQESIAYETETIPDDTLDLDQTAVVQAGEYGIRAARVRVRYENGQEVSRDAEESVVLKEPVNRIQSYGTKVSLQTMDTPNGTITYYRALTVTATSYSPCNSGVDGCLYQTASGAAVKKGVIGVHLDWYRLLKGTQIYVPGYGIGTIADTGSYPYNHNWIDLGFTDAEFATEGKYYGSITIYFLAPFPSTEPWILP